MSKPSFSARRAERLARIYEHNPDLKFRKGILDCLDKRVFDNHTQEVIIHLARILDPFEKDVAAYADQPEAYSQLLGMLYAEGVFDEKFLGQVTNLAARLNSAAIAQEEEMSRQECALQVTYKFDRRYRNAFLNLSENLKQQQRPLLAMIIYEMFIEQFKHGIFRSRKALAGLMAWDAYKELVTPNRYHDQPEADLQKSIQFFDFFEISGLSQAYFDLDTRAVLEAAKKQIPKIAEDEFTMQTSRELKFPEIISQGNILTLKLEFPKEQNPFSLTNFRLGFWSGRNDYLFIEGKVLKNGELASPQMNFIGLREIFAFYHCEKLYDVIKARVIKELYDAVNTGEVQREVFIDISDEELDLLTRPEPQTEHAPEITKPQSNIVAVDAASTLDTNVKAKPKKERKLEIRKSTMTWWNIIAGFKAYGVEIENSHHPMLKYQGRTSRYPNVKMGGDVDGNLHFLKKVCGELQIDFLEFIRFNRKRFAN